MSGDWRKRELLDAGCWILDDWGELRESIESIENAWGDPGQSLENAECYMNEMRIL